MRMVDLPLILKGSKIPTQTYLNSVIQHYSLSINGTIIKHYVIKIVFLDKLDVNPYRALGLAVSAEFWPVIRIEEWDLVPFPIQIQRVVFKWPLLILYYLNLIFIKLIILRILVLLILLREVGRGILQSEPGFPEILQSKPGFPNNSTGARISLF